MNLLLVKFLSEKEFIFKFRYFKAFGIQTQDLFKTQTRVRPHEMARLNTNY